MWHPKVPVALLVLLGFSLTALTMRASANDADSKRIGALIRQLGSGKFQERRAAQKELEAIGAPALEQLKRVPATDLETSKRATELIHKIDEKVLTAALLAPKRVHLKVTDMPALEAVNELTKRAGYSIQALGDRTKVASKKITLDTGDATFWQAFDKLCDQAGLVETAQTPIATSNNYALQRGGFQGGMPSLAVNTDAAQANINVVAGAPKNQHVSYTGSVRARVYPVSEAKAGHFALRLEASAEPRLQGFAVVGTPIISKAIDDQGQSLLLAANPNGEVVYVPVPGPIVGQRAGRRAYLTLPLVTQGEVILRFKSGEKPSKSLKKLEGSFTAQMIAPSEALATITTVLKAAGESVPGKDGGTLKLNAIDKLPSGDYQVQLSLETPLVPNVAGAMIMRNGMIQMRQIQIQVGVGGDKSFNTHGLPLLVDAKGNKFEAVQVPSRRIDFINGVSAQEMTIVFQRPKGHGDPDRLVYHGTRTVNVTIPFSFHDVPLE